LKRFSIDGIVKENENGQYVLYKNAIEEIEALHEECSRLTELLAQYSKKQCNESVIKNY
jgi:hypothetical protein